MGDIIRSVEVIRRHGLPILIDGTGKAFRWPVVLPLEASSAIPSIELRFKVHLLPLLREFTHASES